MDDMDNMDDMDDMDEVDGFGWGVTGLTHQATTSVLSQKFVAKVGEGSASLARRGDAGIVDYVEEPQRSQRRGEPPNLVTNFWDRTLASTSTSSSPVPKYGLAILHPGWPYSRQKQGGPDGIPFPELVDNGADLAFCPTGGGYGAENDRVVRQRSQEGKVHPQRRRVWCGDLVERSPR